MKFTEVFGDIPDHVSCKKVLLVAYPPHLSQTSQSATLMSRYIAISTN